MVPGGVCSSEASVRGVPEAFAMLVSEAVASMMMSPPEVTFPVVSMKALFLLMLTPTARAALTWDDEGDAAAEGASSDTGTEVLPFLAKAAPRVSLP